MWRTNHAFHPTAMLTQEPLFNDTTFRYQLLHDMFVDYATRGVKVGAAEAVAVAATLGIKGPDFFSCDPTQFSSSYAENVLSVAYAPDAGGAGRAYVAWEDGEGEHGWRPAACNTYVDLDLARWW